MIIRWYILIQYLVVVSSEGYEEYFDNFYCRRRFVTLCRGKGVHVGCQFPSESPGPNCRNYTKIVLSEKLKNFIIHYINRKRQHVASGQERVKYGQPLPRPEIMMFVEWDKELAFLARRLADQCTFVHDDCRATTRYLYPGQTVGEVRWRKSADLKDSKNIVRQAIKRILDAWWGEKRRVMAQQLTDSFSLDLRGATWGHFSQLAVWSLQAVGCGAVRHGATNVRLLLVCDFSHTNMLGQRTLSPGPLNDCPKNTMRKIRSQYPLLCVQMSKNIETTEMTDFSQRDYNLEFEDDGVSYDQRPYQESVPPRQTTRVFVPVYDLNDDESTGFKRRFPDYEIDETRQNFEATRKVEEEIEIPETSSEIYEENLGWKSRGHFLSDEVNSNRKHNPDTDRRKITKESDEFEELNTKQNPSYRRKWKKTRNRPPRPGAIALLVNKNMMSSSPSEQWAEQMDNLDQSSTTVDNDFAEQLFIDTGFKIIPTCDKKLNADCIT